MSIIHFPFAFILSEFLLASGWPSCLWVSCKFQRRETYTKLVHASKYLLPMCIWLNCLPLVQRKVPAEWAEEFLPRESFWNFFKRRCIICLAYSERSARPFQITQKLSMSKRPLFAEIELVVALKIRHKFSKLYLWFAVCDSQFLIYIFRPRFSTPKCCSFPGNFLSAISLHEHDDTRMAFHRHTFAIVQKTFSWPGWPDLNSMRTTAAICWE